MTDKKIKELADILELVRKMISFDVYLTVFDTDCIVRYLYPENGEKDGLIIGQPFEDPTGKLTEAIETDRVIHNHLPMESLGIVLEGNIVPVHDEEGRVCGAITTTYLPIDSRARVAQELAIQSVYRKIFTVNLSNNLCATMYISDDVENRNLPQRRYEEFRESIMMSLHPDDIEECARFMKPENLIERSRYEDISSMECRMFDFRKKSYFWVEIAFRRIENYADRKQIVFVYMERDIHERKVKELQALEENQLLIRQLRQVNQKLFNQSIHDGLTGIYNRDGMKYYAEIGLKDAVRKEKWVFLLAADVNRLKYINDNFGHIGGDKAITKVAGFLTEAAGKRAIVCRTGGDEFVVIDFFEKDSNEPENITARLQQVMDDYNKDTQDPYEIRASYGWEFRPAAEISGMDALMHSADKKMYEMKRNR